MSSLPKRPFADVDVSESDDPSTSTAPPPKKHYEKSRHNKRPKPGALRSLASIPTAKLLYPRISEPQITNVPFQQPLPLLTFSYTPDRVLHFDNSALRYLVPPPPEADLHYGLKTWEKKPDGKGRIDALLRAWTKVRKEDVCGMRNVDVGVVCWRGVMTKILTTPYETMDNWEMNVMLVDGTLYLEEHLTPQRLKVKNNLVGKQRAMTYTGYAFESWCTSESPPPPPPPPGTGTGTDEPVAPVAPGWAGEPVAPPGWGGDVDTNVQWCSVVKTKLGNTRMVIGGEVDCVRGEYKGTNDTMVELKTSQVIRWPDDQRKFEKKLLKFYFQSFLLGVPDILVGFRSDKDNGALQLLQSFKTLEIPRMVRGQRKAWDPRVCLGWGEEVLGWIRGLVEGGMGEQRGEGGEGGEGKEMRMDVDEDGETEKVEEGQEEVRKDKAEGAGEGPRETTETKPKPRVRIWRVRFTPKKGAEAYELDEEGIRDVESDGGVPVPDHAPPEWVSAHSHPTPTQEESTARPETETSVNATAGPSTSTAAADPSTSNEMSAPSTLNETSAPSTSTSTATTEPSASTSTSTTVPSSAPSSSTLTPTPTTSGRVGIFPAWYWAQLEQWRKEEHARRHNSSTSNANPKAGPSQTHSQSHSHSQPHSHSESQSYPEPRPHPEPQSHPHPESHSHSHPESQSHPESRPHSPRQLQWEHETPESMAPRRQRPRPPRSPSPPPQERIRVRDAPPHFQFREAARAGTIGSSSNAPAEDLAGHGTASVGIQDRDNEGEGEGEGSGAGGGGEFERSRQTVSGWRL